MSPKPKIALGVHLPEAPLLRCKEEDVVSTMAIDTPLQSPTLSESTVPFSSPSTLRADSGWSTPALAQPTSWRGTQNVGHPVFEDVHTPQGGTLDNDWNGSPVSSTHHPISSWDLSDSPLSHLHQLYTDEFPCWQYRFPPTNRDLSSSQSPHSSGGHTTKPAREHPQTHAENCPSSAYTRSVAVHTNSFFGLQSAEDRSASVFATTVQAVSVSHFHSKLISYMA